MTNNLSGRLARLERAAPEPDCPECDPGLPVYEIYEGEPDPPGPPPCGRCGGYGPGPVSMMVIRLAGPRPTPGPGEDAAQPPERGLDAGRGRWLD